MNTNNHVSSNVTSTNSSSHANSLVNLRSILNFAVFNSRSVGNKIESIIDHVVENDIGLFTVTETWLNDANSVSIAQLSVAGYSFKNFPNSTTTITVVVVLGFCFETLSKSHQWMGRETSPLNFRSGLLKSTIAL